MNSTVIILALVGICAALFIGFKMVKSFKKGSCDSCCNCHHDACRNKN